MMKKTNNAGDEIIEAKIISDFLPSPHDLVKKDETVKIFIPDRSYDNQDLYPNLEEIEASQKYKEELEAQLKQLQKSSNTLKIKPLLEANIGSGADWPAFLAEITPYLGTAGGLALFFSGKIINENIDAWLSIGTKIIALVKLTGGYFNRGSAFLFALAKLNEQNKKVFTSIQLIEYQSLDARFEDDWKNINFKNTNQISDELPEELIAGEIHFFRVLIDGKEIEILVRGNDLEIRIKS